MAHPAFTQTDHRPWPLPTKPWIMKQSWHDLLFLHWVVDASELRARIPEGLEIDLFEGEAYIALVPFGMRGVSPRGAPSIPGVSNFPEFNVRTYVTRDGKPGVWFFSLDITKALGVWVARSFFHLPYRKAEIDYCVKGDSVHYTSVISEAEKFNATYKPTRKYTAAPGSFAQWATERYCLYASDQAGRIYRGEIQHPQWPLYEAECTLTENTMLDGFTLGAMQKPLFAKSIEVVVYPLEKLI